MDQSVFVKSAPINCRLNCGPVRLPIIAMANEILMEKKLHFIGGGLV